MVLKLSAAFGIKMEVNKNPEHGGNSYIDAYMYMAYQLVTGSKDLIFKEYLMQSYSENSSKC